MPHFCERVSRGGSGNRWCVCLGTVVDAIKAGIAPQIVLEATHISVLEFLDLEVLQQHAAT